MKKLIIGTAIITASLAVLAICLSWMRGGVFQKMLEDNLMILGVAGIAGGGIAMFASNGPIGSPSSVDRGYDPSLGLMILLGGIANLGMSIWVFNHPGLFV